VTHSAFPYPPATPSGDWLVNLPGQASIGEVLVWATAAPANPWDTPPVAPVGTTVSVATTFVVPSAWIDVGGDSFVLPYGAAFTFKQLFRVAPTAPQAGSTVALWQVVWYLDRAVNGTYENLALPSSDTLGWSMTWTVYGPGDITSDGLLLPADAGALYCTLHQIGGIHNANRFGAPIAHVEYSTNTVADGSGTTRIYWDASTGAALRNLQRIDNAATHTIPLMPDRLPI
jgi:hypothetical protein